MKKIQKYLWIVLVFALVLSGCEAIETTPPPIEDAPEVVETETQEAVIPVLPTEPLVFVDDDGRMICTIQGPLLPELTAEEKEQLAEFAVTDEDWSKGPEDAILTLVEYTDFFCPYCGQAYEIFEDLVEKHPNDVRLVYRALPLDSLHPTAPIAAHAAEAAGKQGKFWEMYAGIFSNQSELAQKSAEDLSDWLVNFAKEELDLDLAQFEADLVSEEVVNKITEGQTKAFNAGISSTPSIMINDRPMDTRMIPYIGSFVEVMKSEGEIINECPPFVIDQDKEYTATIETENGEMIIELYPKAAPLAVNSFVYLAQEGFYDDVSFHRVYHEFMAQTGDPSGTGMGGAGYQFREEIVPELSFDEPYMLGVARTQQEATSGSQFFITYVPYPSLNGNYTIFGKLIDGIDVFEKISERDSDNNPDLPLGDKIISITIKEK